MQITEFSSLLLLKCTLTRKLNNYIISNNIFLLEELYTMFKMKNVKYKRF